MSDEDSRSRDRVGFLWRGLWAALARAAEPWVRAYRVSEALGWSRLPVGWRNSLWRRGDDIRADRPDAARLTRLRGFLADPAEPVVARACRSVGYRKSSRMGSVLPYPKGGNDRLATALAGRLSRAGVAPDQIARCGAATGKVRLTVRGQDA